MIYLFFQTNGDYVGMTELNVALTSEYIANQMDMGILYFLVPQQHEATVETIRQLDVDGVVQIGEVMEALFNVVGGVLVYNSSAFDAVRNEVIRRVRQHHRLNLLPTFQEYVEAEVLARQGDSTRLYLIDTTVTQSLLDFPDP